MPLISLNTWHQIPWKCARASITKRKSSMSGILLLSKCLSSLPVVPVFQNMNALLKKDGNTPQCSRRILKLTAHCYARELRRIFCWARNCKDQEELSIVCITLLTSRQLRLERLSTPFSLLNGNETFNYVCTQCTSIQNNTCIVWWKWKFNKVATPMYTQYSRHFTIVQVRLLLSLWK